MAHSSASSPVLGNPSSHQQRVDKMVAVVRRESTSIRPSIFKPAPPKPEPSCRLLDHRIAEELEYVARRLEHLGGILSEDSNMVVRHSGPLQSIDLMKQSLGQLSRVIAAQDKEAVVDQMTVTELKGRLQRKALRHLVDEAGAPPLAKQ